MKSRTTKSAILVAERAAAQGCATHAPAPARSLPALLAELVELGREAWRISERERAVRAEIEALREIERGA